jgi:hypothetical protein
MGRELRRVPLDFAWPINKLWVGFVNPHYRPCPENEKTCFDGNTAAGKWLDALSHFIALLGEEAAVAPHAEELQRRGRLYPHPYVQQFAQAPRHELPRDVTLAGRDIQDVAERRAFFDHMHRNHHYRLLPLTPELQGLVEGLAGKKCEGSFGSAGIGYDLYNRLKSFAGITDEQWGICPVCGGEGLDPAVKQQYEAWRPYGPPKGPGFQLWTTTNEGAPYSPVFDTLDALCQYLEPNVSVFGSDKTTAANWKKMLEADFVHHTIERADGTKAVFM